MQDVTFGITTFNRPQLLQQLIQSIRVHYPNIPILVVDNGNRHAALPDDIRVIRLPFDCGLSRARNALIDHLQTKYLLLLEDDFRFTSETDIQPLRQVLEAAPDVGAVGGAIRGSNDRVTCYALDIEVCRQTMRVREATHRVEVTPSGVPYRLCDMVWNFALFRREMLDEHRWVDALKIGEHCPFFYEVKRASRWRIASCSLSKIYHIPDRRPATYLKYRRRAVDYFRAYLAARGIQRYERVLPYHYEDEPTLVPPVIVLAVGHSGTSITTRMLQALGWNLEKADKAFAEHIEIRSLNRLIIKRGSLDPTAAREALSNLPMPWAIKDPRFVQTLHHWLPYLAELECKPVLLRLRRDLDATLASYQRRNAPGDVNRRVGALVHRRDELYEQWPWRRMTLEFEKIAAAVALFDLQRFQAAQDVPDTSAVAEPASKPPFIAIEDSAVLDSSMNAQFVRASLAIEDSAVLDSSTGARSATSPLAAFGEELALHLDSSPGFQASSEFDVQGDSMISGDLETDIQRFLQQTESDPIDLIDDEENS